MDLPRVLFKTARWDWNERICVTWWPTKANRGKRRPPQYPIFACCRHHIYCSSQVPYSSSRPTSNATIMSIVHVPIDSTTAVSKLAHLRLVCQKVGHTRKLHGQTEKLVVLSSLIVLDQHLRKPERLLTLETLLRTQRTFADRRSYQKTPNYHSALSNNVAT